MDKELVTINRIQTELAKYDTDEQMRILNYTIDRVHRVRQAEFDKLRLAQDQRTNVKLGIWNEAATSQENKVVLLRSEVGAPTINSELKALQPTDNLGAVKQNDNLGPSI